MGSYYLKGKKGDIVSPLIFKRLREIDFKKAIVVTPEDDEELIKELDLLFKLAGEKVKILSYPERDNPPKSEVLEDSRVQSERIKALIGILKEEKAIIVSSLSSLLERIISKKDLISTSIELALGKEFPFEELLEKLSSLGYEREDIVVEKGKYAVRGGIVDFFPPDREKPIRVEFFGDEVVDLRYFDPATQRSTGRIDSIKIFTFKDVDPSKGNESLIFDYLDEDTKVFLVDCLYALSKAERFYERGKELLEDPSHIMDSLRNFELYAIGVDPPFSVDDEISYNVEELPSGIKVIPYLKEKAVEGFSIYAVSPEKDLCKKLLSFLKRKGIASKGIVGEFFRGFSSEEDMICIVTFKNIFGHHVRKRRAPRPRDIFDFRSLKEGSPVVHYDHGIGIYRGIVGMEVNGVKTDFVLLEYAEGDKLYVPVYHLEKLQRYSGDGKVKIDRLGSKRWSILKKRTKESLKKILRELVELYAIREVTKGFRFSIPEEEYYEFVRGFPYEETPDQERAIEEVLMDMASDKPMDRLVCGDVGFGKTEVAMRAAFVAAMNGKQVAVLVPTTILAEQHYINFKERFKDFPIVIEMLSRFRTKAEQKRIIEKLKRGEIDIIIGTHRLLQKDVSFKNLGLLIIDEEQRFGVSSKEKLRELRKNVDTLVLTATPIPRTLQQSLSGLKKLSIILTPPPNRKTVKTIITRFDEEIVKEAIEREVERGGQVYFVHNDIETIYGMERVLKKLVPDVRIEVAHGKMKEKDLERIMLGFFKGEVDLLLCTTIVENGLDVPNANTMIINHAERFGLAQLYQLRGRIGRSDVRSYAYLLLPKEADIPKSAIKRLKILKEYEDLGSGYYIAMKDLEMRGCGNLLGKAQWGKIGEMGIEMYLRILDEAVREIKGEVREEVEAEIDLGIPAYIPESYISSPSDKFEIYRRMSAVSSEDEVEDLIRELRDRFGPPPKEVFALAEILKLKLLARDLLVEKLIRKEDKLILKFHEKTPVNVDRFLSFISKNNCWSIKDPYSAVFQMDKNCTLGEIYRELRNLRDFILQN